MPAPTTPIAPPDPDPLTLPSTEPDVEPKLPPAPDRTEPATPSPFRLPDWAKPGEEPAPKG